MPRSALAVLVGGTLAVLAAAVLTLATDERTLAFSNGVAPSEAVADLQPARRACQRAVPAPTAFGAVQLAAESAGKPGPRLKVTVLDARTHAALGEGNAPAGPQWQGQLPEAGPLAAVGRVPGGRSVEVCIESLGPTPVSLLGTREDEPHDGRLAVGHGDDLRRVAANLNLTFLRERPSTLLAQLPAAFGRAALWHPPLVGAWTFWLLAALVALGLPLLGGLALRAACRGAAPAD